MNLDEYKKFVKDKRQMSKIDAMAILANDKKQNENQKAFEAQDKTSTEGFINK
jgi:hypothetical protein